MSNGVWLGHVYIRLGQCSISLGKCYIWLGHSMVRGGDNFRVDIKADIKWDYRGDIR